MSAPDSRLLLERCAEVLRREFGGGWELVYDGDNLVFSDATRVAKVAKHPDGAVRLTTGVDAALRVAAISVCVVTPLLPRVMELEIGAVSLWPLITHRGIDAHSLNYDDGVLLGASLSQLPLVGHNDSTWDPLARIPYRLSNTSVPTGLVRRAWLLYDVFERLVPTRAPLVFAHGDMSIGNVLFTSTEALLIDLDSAGGRPADWDMSCLKLQLIHQEDNEEAYAGVLAGWSSRAEPPIPDENLVALKAFMATTSQLTFPPTQESVARIEKRFLALERWATGESLSKLPAVR